ncbi:glutathione S-transferase [Pseudoalteromonas sp. NBT06-2]|uniref:glutathione S-transferase family protein n=1 Tax=Pseudoalteromonas sp. NBT06-2 TaxID=2025950 RepID=UPI000BA7440C|nr:glutathione S-transferase family protein [Pseudoalteromonas sp. NBT06-2]PAJ74954.1 glutathione S-transferase [Pseudoalteromonas sp. NBT06-2]
MYILYYYPLNASMAPHFVLEEMGLDYTLQLVDRHSNAHKSDEYLVLNPTGRIPTLVDDGFAIFESAAICLHLCDKNPNKSLMPKVGDKNRPLFYQWLMYLNNTVQAELMLYFYPQRHTSETGHIKAIVEAQEKRITDMFLLLDTELEGKDYLVSDSITVCDYFLFMLAVWADEFKQPPLSFRNLSRYLKKIAKRDAVISVCKKENLSLVDYR